MLIRPTDIYSNEFRTVSRQTVSAVLIATPEAASDVVTKSTVTQKVNNITRTGMQHNHPIAAQPIKACIVTLFKSNNNRSS